jgi:hypothetical protein
MGLFGSRSRNNKEADPKFVGEARNGVQNGAKNVRASLSRQFFETKRTPARLSACQVRKNLCPASPSRAFFGTKNRSASLAGEFFETKRSPASLSACQNRKNYGRASLSQAWFATKNRPATGNETFFGIKKRVESRSMVRFMAQKIEKTQSDQCRGVDDPNDPLLSNGRPAEGDQAGAAVFFRRLAAAAIWQSLRGGR